MDGATEAYAGAMLRFGMLAWRRLLLAPPTYPQDLVVPPQMLQSVEFAIFPIDNRPLTFRFDSIPIGIIRP